MAHVLTLTVGGTSFEIYMLNPGEFFPRFGGSRHGLRVGKTASMIVRTKDAAAGAWRDVEHNIDDPDLWAWIARVVNREKATFVATVPVDQTAEPEATGG